MKKKYVQKGGNVMGMGGVGIILFPSLPFLEKFNFDMIVNEKGNLKPNLRNNVNKNINANTVSKIYKLEESFLFECDKYLLILNKYDLKSKPDYFNLPLNYGKIDYELVSRENQIYNIEWLNNLNWLNQEKFNISKLKLESIPDILMKFFPCDKQITFTLGRSLLEIDFSLFFEKYKSAINIIKFLNSQGLLYDDLKLDNILIVDELLKLCDFSSITRIDDINLDYFLHGSNLSKIFYPTYNPLLISMLKFYLLKKNGNQSSDKVILQSLADDFQERKTTEEFKDGFEQVFIRFKALFSFVKFHHLKDVNYEIRYFFINGERIQMGRNNISSIFFLDLLLDNLKLSGENYNIYLKNFKNYLELKFNENLEEIILDLFRRIHYYSMGYMILDFLATKIIEREIIDDLFKFNKLIYIAIKFCAQILKNSSNFFYIEQNLDEILSFYNNNTNVRRNNLIGNENKISQSEGGKAAVVAENVRRVNENLGSKRQTNRKNNGNNNKSENKNRAKKSKPTRENKNGEN